ncbi:hypothetical protein VVD49_03930 [Uliginosibacterium sp. H3]|uniref:Uncharacterized protein n=1 Tax=Uliginosibacterium silvisoli TaxID=3114758 RepID=A0ABU6K1C6_9RHOO|nr:hypothetical protein [Uliginosibacterium sp. H3]
MADAITALPSATASNAIAGLLSTGASRAVLTPDVSSAISPLTAAPSSQVSLSQFALGVLAQQASDPTLSIDSAVAGTLSSLLSSGTTGTGPLYTATGQLQQFAGALLLTQTPAAEITPDNASAQALQLPTTPATDAQRLQDITDSVRESFLATQLDALDTLDEQISESQAAQTAGIENNSATRADAAAQLVAQRELATAAAPAASAAVQAAAVTPASDVATTDLTAVGAATTTPAVNSVIDSVPASTLSTTDQLPTTADINDPYQQAALASGLTAFGKELNSYLPGEVAADFPAAVSATRAVRPVVSREEEAAATR